MLLTETPKLVNSARLLYDGIKNGGRHKAGVGGDAVAAEAPALGDAVDELRLRIDGVEAGLERQAELSSRMAAQEHALSEGLRAVSARATAALWLGGAALLMAAAAVLVALLR
jgi:hypothetical protein